MQSKPDAQLLREYAETGVERAFTEIVRRHTNLVYSAALRQVESPAVAAEIAQKVFIGLARGARTLSRKLAADASLAGWLCRCARNHSLNYRRDEFRRQSREQQAMQQLTSIADAAPDWEQLRAVLDDAMSELSEGDYDALVLRFFKNQDLRSVGLALGVSDDAAQKRVSRALEKLREHLSRRNIGTTAAALSLAISANAVQAAPAGLAASIATAATLAGTAATTTVTAALAKTIAMTTLQKVIISATLATAVGAGLYEARQAVVLRSRVQSLQQEQAPLAAQVRQLKSQHDEALKQLATLQAENEQLKSNQNTAELLKLRGEVTRLKATDTEASDPFVQSALDWKAKEARLRQLMEQRPDQSIPELQLLTDDAWLYTARDANLNTETGIRKALSVLRKSAQNDLMSKMNFALQEYAKANHGEFPRTVSELKPYFDPPVDDAILARYQVVSTEANNFPPDKTMGGKRVIVEKSPPVDPTYDTYWIIGKDGSFTGMSYQAFAREQALAPEMRTLAPALAAYAAANNGMQPTDPSLLQPYLTSSEQQTALQKILQSKPATPK